MRSISTSHKNFSELFFVWFLSALSWLDIDKDELDVVVVVVLVLFFVVLLLVWSWPLWFWPGSFFTTWLLVVAAEAEAVSVASALCQFVSSWETKWRSLSRYWLYSSTSLWPAPWKETKKRGRGLILIYHTWRHPEWEKYCCIFRT